MENFSELSKSQLETAKNFYIKSLISKAFEEYLTPIQDAFNTYCQNEELMYDDGISAIQLNIFSQGKFKYYIGVCAVPHTNAKQFCMDHGISKDIIQWRGYEFTTDGIQEMIKNNEKLFKKVAFYSDVELTNLYSLPVIVDQITNSNIKLTHITVKDELNG